MSSKTSSWTKMTLGQVAKWSSGGTPKRSNHAYYGGDIPWVKTGDLGERYLTEVSEYISEEGLKNSSAKLFPRGSIGLAMYGATIGKVSIFGIDAACNQACAVAVPNEKVIQRDFLYYLLKSEKEAFIKKGKGGAQPNISQTIIKEHEISIPPVSEQKRIADKLDNVLAKVEAAQARLDKIPAILKRFRQSVLTAATSGELTKDWREENYKSIDEWRSFDIGSIAEVKTGTTPLKSRSEYYENGTIPWLTSAVTGKDTVSSANTFVTKLAVKECRLKVFKPETLLVAMYGEGKTRGQVTELAIEAAINQACAAVIVDTSIASVRYVKLAIEKNYELTRLMAEGGSQPNLNLSKVKSIPISIPTLDEQKEVVRKTNDLFELASNVERQYKSAQKSVDKLTQSILSKAFRGELL